MSCEGEEWRFKETMGGNRYGALSKEGDGRRVQEKEAGYTNGN